MTTEPRSTTCPWCDRNVLLRRNGTTYRHKHPGQAGGHWQASNCDGSGRRPGEWNQRLRITPKGATT